MLNTPPDPPVGARVKAEARFWRNEGKSYAFNVQVSDQVGEIGRGTHHRATVPSPRLLAGVQCRRPPSMDSGTGRIRTALWRGGPGSLR